MNVRSFENVSNTIEKDIISNDLKNLENLLLIGKSTSFNEIYNYLKALIDTKVNYLILT
jgi:hypothetical protein